ncbi:MAG TPA: dTDP-4-dehydrorhamnose 3,5-epimerase [Flavobacteriales bacterium]
MIVERTALEGLLLIRPDVFGDERGHFLESFNARKFADATGLDVQFVQDNESRSAANVLRGLHLQRAPHAQGKLVRVVVGSVMDVCVDLRPGSATFGRHVKLRLDDRGKEMLYVPEGFAHGFVSLEDGTIFTYKCTALYHPPAERILKWDDPDLGIDWGVKDPVVSARDRAGKAFKEEPWAN